MALRALSLCSGIGGLELGIKLALPEAVTVAYVEKDGYCRRVLKARMADGWLDEGPIYEDLCEFDGREWRGTVDLVCGGFPCQDISQAGRREGIREGNRSGLWFEFARVIGEVAPALVFVENVAALLGRGMATVLGDLSGLGFDAEWATVSASEVGAPQVRQRVFILGYSRGEQRRAGRDNAQRGSVLLTAQREGEAHHEERHRLQHRSCQRSNALASAASCFPPGPGDRDRWAAVLRDAPHLEPAIRRVAHGFPRRVDRLRCLGNAVVPLVAAHALRTLAARIDT